MKSSKVNPAKTALLVIDMQKAFVDSDSPICVAGAQETIPAIANVVEKAREAGVKIIWVCRQHDPEGLDMEAFRRELLKEKGCLDLLADGNPMSQLAEGLSSKKQDETVYKKRFSAFYKTELDDLLEKEGIETLILTGTQTPNCIRATACDALERDYRTIVLAECTSSATKSVQNANLKDMANMGIEVIKKSVPFLDELSMPENAGTVYQIKASLMGGRKRVYRIFDCPAQSLLSDVVDAVLMSCDADFDHLYHVDYRDERYAPEFMREYESDLGSFSPLETSLDKLDLFEGAQMLLVYDYGADWEFLLEVTRINPDGDRSKGVQPVKSIGKLHLDEY